MQFAMYENAISAALPAIVSAASHATLNGAAYAAERREAALALSAARYFVDVGSFRLADDLIGYAVAWLRRIP